jgi:lipopolysaccharide/colanic/teichoic acid biosynthesis glycosyltransferase
MNAHCKRAFDVSLAIIGLLLASPIMAVVAVLVWLDSPGNVFFSQERLGLQGRPFRLYKFRKFPVQWKEAGPRVTVARDVRMTRVGAVLEKTKLDELPQLWNVLKGDMSFVGARPESMYFADMFTGRYAEILNHLPGIFGPTQFILPDESILYPPDEDPEAFYRRVLFPQKAEVDLDYLSRANCLSDVIWIFRGIQVSLVSAIDWRRFLKRYARLTALDAALAAAAWTLAALFRFGGIPKGADLDIFVSGLGVFPPLLIAGMLAGRCYRSILKYLTVFDFAHITQVASLSWLFGFSALMLVFKPQTSVLYLFPSSLLTMLALLLMSRTGLYWWERKMRAGHRSRQDRQVLIYGAGPGGAALSLWMSQGSAGLKPIGFIDDNPDMLGRLVGGLPVLGYQRDIPTMHEKYGIDEIWVTFGADDLKRKQIQNLCKSSGITLVSLAEFEAFSVREDIMEHFEAAPHRVSYLSKRI